MNTFIKQTILDKIKSYQKIFIYRHIRIDGDCVGASMGLKGILSLTFPDKDIRIVDDQVSEHLDFLGRGDSLATPADCADALAIVVDTATANRISNDSYKLCREVIKIDHHLPVENYGHINWVEDTWSSACQIIGDFYLTFREELRIDSAAATALYAGMVTDTGRFKYDRVDGQALRTAAAMLDVGVDTPRLFAQLYLEEFGHLKFKSAIYDSMAITPNGVAYIHIGMEMQRAFGLTTESASTAISALEGIRGAICWAAFIDLPDGSIRVRLRSRFVTINHIAEHWRGGGHACASGATLLSADEIPLLLAEADECVKLYKETHEDWL